MDRPSKTQAIKKFLELNTHADLAGLYNHDMECQLNVAQDGGTRIEGDFKGRAWHGWTNGVQMWKSFRIPWKAMSEPEYTDTEINFDLAEHVEGVGLTGWDWVSRVSRWVAYDFDAITGHSDKHSRKLSETELEDVANRVTVIEWCTLRKSTSGKGLHLYVFLNPVPTQNHNEHAALARAILGQLSALARFDFATKVDAAGGNMWIWHRKMKGTDGLKLLKAGRVLEQAPVNWKDHIDVIVGKRRKTNPLFIENQKDERSDLDKWFDDLTSKQSRVILDEDHMRLLNYIKEINPTSWWDNDHWMFVTHTFHLKQAHEELQLRGKFETLAQGTESPHDHNVFMFPVRNGAWAVRRYTPGVAEHALWTIDGAGWTRIFFNKEPDLKIAAKAFEGLEHPTGGFSFRHSEQAKQAAELLGAKIELPNWILGRKCLLKEHKDGRLVFEIEQGDDMGLGGMEDWIAERNKYKKVFDVKARDVQELDVSAFDDTIRHVVTLNGDDAGWLVKSESKWKSEPLVHVKHALTSLGFPSKEANLIIGTNIMKCWTLVNRPFQDEYPIGREWNRNAPQLRFRPTTNIDELSFPTWLMILEHVGQGLNRAISEHPWCQANGIVTGADYLKCWIASIFQSPLEPLPYLFFFSSEQGTGKSIFHEALARLVTHGVVRVDQALVSSFNGELANAIVGVVEETDLRRNKSAYNRIKDWVTAPQLSIRALYQTPYMIPNSCHFIQCMPKSTWIFTSIGPRQIKDLIGKACTIITNGRYYPTEGFFYTGKQQLFKIKTKQGYELECTADHPIQTDHFGLKCWTPTSELKPGDKICLNNHYNIRWEGNGTYEEGYVLGWLMGDGSLRKHDRGEINPNDPVLYFYEDTETIPYIHNILDDCNILNREGGYTIAGVQLKRLTEEFNFYHKDDVVNFEMCSSEFYAGFLSAMLDTDGSINIERKRVSIYQSDYPILQCLQRMLLRFGITCKIYLSRLERQLIGPKKTIINAKKSYELQILTQTNLQRLYKRCNPKLNRKRKQLELCLKCERQIKTEYYMEVSEIVQSKIEETYDIIVPEIHAFDANGLVVHNCSNDHLACPITFGDTRIVYIQVPPLKSTESKRILFPKLDKESPDFLAEMLALEIPTSSDRLNLPVIDTEEKHIAEDSNQTMLEQFLKEECHYVTGATILYGEFFERFLQWLDPTDRGQWTKIKIGRELPPRHPKGRIMKFQGKHFIGNISWTPFKPGDETFPRLMKKDDCLIPEN